MKKLTAILCLCLILTSCGSTEQPPLGDDRKYHRDRGCDD